MSQLQTVQEEIVKQLSLLTGANKILENTLFSVQSNNLEDFDKNNLNIVQRCYNTVVAPEELKLLELLARRQELLKSCVF